MPHSTRQLNTILPKLLALLAILGVCSNGLATIAQAATMPGIDYSAFAATSPQFMSAVGQNLLSQIQAANGNLDIINSAFQNAIQYALANSDPASAKQILTLYQNFIRPILEQQHNLTDPNNPSNLSNLNTAIQSIGQPVTQLQTLLAVQPTQSGYYGAPASNTQSPQYFVATPQNVAQLGQIYTGLLAAQGNTAAQAQLINVNGSVFAGGINVTDMAQGNFNAANIIQGGLALTRDNATGAQQAAGAATIINSLGLDPKVAQPLGALAGIIAQSNSTTNTLNGQLAGVNANTVQLTSQVGQLLGSITGSPQTGMALAGVAGAFGLLGNGDSNGTNIPGANGQTVPLPTNLNATVQALTNGVAGVTSGIAGLGTALSNGAATVPGAQNATAVAAGAPPGAGGAGGGGCSSGAGAAGVPGAGTNPAAPAASAGGDAGIGGATAVPPAFPGETTQDYLTRAGASAADLSSATAAGMNLNAPATEQLGVPTAVPATSAEVTSGNFSIDPATGDFMSNNAAAPAPAGSTPAAGGAPSGTFNAAQSNGPTVNAHGLGDTLTLGNTSYPASQVDAALSTAEENGSNTITMPDGRTYSYNAALNAYDANSIEGPAASGGSTSGRFQRDANGNIINPNNVSASGIGGSEAPKPGIATINPGPSQVTGAANTARPNTNAQISQFLQGVTSVIQMNNQGNSSANNYGNYNYNTYNNDAYAAPALQAATYPATNVTPTSMTLNGYVSAANTSNVTAWFDYGPTTSLGFSTTPQAVGAGAYGVTLSNLPPVNVLYFRAAARSDQLGTQYGPVVSSASGSISPAAAAQTLEQQLQQQFFQQMQNATPLVSPSGSNIGAKVSVIPATKAQLTSTPANYNDLTGGFDAGNPTIHQTAAYNQGAAAITNRFSPSNFGNTAQTVANAFLSGVAQFSQNPVVQSLVQRGIQALADNPAVKNALSSPLGGGAGGKGVPVQMQPGDQLTTLHNILKNVLGTCNYLTGTFQQQQTQKFNSQYQTDPKAIEDVKKAQDKSDAAAKKQINDRLVPTWQKFLDDSAYDAVLRDDAKVKQANACSDVQTILNKQIDNHEKAMKDPSGSALSDIKCPAGMDAERSRIASGQNITVWDLLTVTNPTGDSDFQQVNEAERQQLIQDDAKKIALAQLTAGGGIAPKMDKALAQTDADAGPQDGSNPPPKIQVPLSVAPEQAAKIADRPADWSLVTRTAEQQGAGVPADAPAGKTSQLLDNFSGAQAATTPSNASNNSRSNSILNSILGLANGLLNNNSNSTADNTQPPTPPAPVLPPSLAMVTATSTINGMLESGIQWGSQNVSACTFSTNWISFGDGTSATADPSTAQASGAGATPSGGMFIYHPNVFKMSVLFIPKDGTNGPSQVAQYATRLQRTYPAAGYTTATSLTQETTYTPNVTGLAANFDIVFDLGDNTMTVPNVPSAQATPDGVASAISLAMANIASDRALARFKLDHRMTFAALNGRLIVTGSSVVPGQVPDHATYGVSCTGNDNSTVQQSVTIPFGTDSIQ